MSETQWKRLDVVERVKAGRLGVGEGAQITGVSARQFLTIRQRVAEEGRKALVHGLTGRSPVNRVCDEVRETILGLRRGKYDGFNDHHFADKLREVEKVIVSRLRRRRRSDPLSAAWVIHSRLRSLVQLASISRLVS